MTDEDKKQFKLAAIRGSQTDIHEAVNELRNKRPGLSFQSAWNMLEKTKPELFEALDKASDELSKIEQGTQYKQAFPPNPPTTAPDNVPPFDASGRAAHADAGKDSRRARPAHGQRR